MEKKERLVWLDVAKGIAIILMVLGHSGLPSVINNFIFAFHMPFFFIASGLVTAFSKDISFGQFTIRKIRGLLVPFFWYSIALFLLILLNPTVDISLSQLECNGWGDWAIWFVPILFLALLLSKLVLSCPKLLRLFLILVLPLSSAVLCYLHIFLPWKLSVLGFATFFVIAGNWITDSGLLSKSVQYINEGEAKTILVLLLSLGIVFTISHFWRLDMALNDVKPIVPKTMAAFAGFALLSIIAIGITIPSNKLFNLIKSVLSKIGRETFMIMALSQIVVVYVNTYFAFNPIVKYLIAIAGLVLCYYLEELIKRIYQSVIKTNEVNHKCR